MTLRKWPTSVQAIPRLEMCGILSREGVRNEWEDEKTKGAVDWSHTSCWLCKDPIFISSSWFSAPPWLTLPVGSRPDCWRNDVLCRAGDIEKQAGPKRALPSRGRGVLIQGMLPTTAQHDDVAVSDFEKILASQGHSWSRKICQPRFR